MAQSNLNPGDIVVLKSGSPDMTVNEIITIDYQVMGGSVEKAVNDVIVQWFDKNNNVQTAKFTEPQLEKAG